MSPDLNAIENLWFRVIFLHPDKVINTSLHLSNRSCAGKMTSDLLENLKMLFISMPTCIQFKQWYLRKNVQELAGQQSEQTFVTP